MFLRGILGIDSYPTGCRSWCRHHIFRDRFSRLDNFISHISHRFTHRLAKFIGSLTRHIFGIVKKIVGGIWHFLHFASCFLHSTISRIFFQELFRVLYPIKSRFFPVKSLLSEFPDAQAQKQQQALFRISLALLLHWSIPLVVTLTAADSSSQFTLTFRLQSTPKQQQQQKKSVFKNLPLEGAPFCFWQIWRSLISRKKLVGTKITEQRQHWMGQDLWVTEEPRQAWAEGACFRLPLCLLWGAAEAVEAGRQSVRSAIVFRPLSEKATEKERKLRRNRRRLRNRRHRS